MVDEGLRQSLVQSQEADIAAGGVNSQWKLCYDEVIKRDAFHIRRYMLDPL